MSLPNMTQPVNSIPILQERVKRLEEYLEMHKQVLESHRAQIQTLTALVATLTSQISSHMFNQPTAQPSLPIASMPITSLPKPLPLSYDGYLQQAYPSPQLLTKAPVIASAKPLSIKRQRALAVTKAFVLSLPVFGLKTVTLPSGEDEQTKKRPRPRKAMPVVDSSVLRSLSSLGSPSRPSTANINNSMTNVVTSSPGSSTDGRADKLPRLEFNISMCKSLHRYEDRLQCAEALHEQLQRGGVAQVQAFLRDGGRDLLLTWLRDEHAALVNNSSVSDELLHVVVQILQYADWNEEIVKDTRYDKLLRKIYKLCAEHPPYEAVVDTLRRVWPVYRSLFLQGGSQAGNLDDES